MKKNHLIVSLVQAFMIIVSVILFPVIATGQDLDAQKKERCQNNKARIVELEKQVKVINAELSQEMEPKEIEDARTQMVFVRSYKTLDNRYKKSTEMFMKIAAQYNFDVEKCRNSQSELDDNRYTNCITKLEEIIAKKIDKATSLNRVLLAKRIEIEKQIASHRTNLVTLGCDANNNTGNTPDISGTWKALKWSYEFTQNGKTFSWKITNDAAYGEKADGEFLKGNRIKATWTNKNGKDSGEGTVIVENGRVTQINWDNGVAFKRN